MEGTLILKLGKASVNMATDPTYPILLRKFRPKGLTFHNISAAFLGGGVSNKAQVETDAHERTE